MSNLKISDLTPDDKNYNKGSEFGNSLIEKSLRKFGAGRSILLDKNNRIIAGNKTIENAGAVGLEDIIVVETTGNQIVAVKRMDIDLDSKQGRELALADNASAKASINWDFETIKVDWQEIEMQEWGIEIPDFEVLEAEEDDFAAPEGGIETDIVLGDLFEIGEHRLLCGDSTDSDQVAKLMNGQKADMLFTDPPYNVGFNGRSGKFDVIENDDLKTEDFDKFIEEFAQTVHTLEIPLKYIWCNWKFYGTLQKHFELNACIVWAKNVFGLGRGYRHQHEFCFFEGKLDEGINNESDLWEIKKDSKYMHPTQKPVELSARALNNHKSAKNILDLFGGSGSTLAGIHQLERVGYVMELDPKYCQVILDRMKKLDPSLIIKKNGVTL
jgi:site-specific DNA-methyltransferase (adenine-specific)